MVPAPLSVSVATERSSTPAEMVMLAKDWLATLLSTRVPGPVLITPPPVYVTGELMVAEISTEAFKPISRAQVLGGKCWTTPVLANGKIYCRNAVGDVVAFPKEDGTRYTCIQAHTSQAGWQPPAAPALWNAAEESEPLQIEAET